MAGEIARVKHPMSRGQRIFKSLVLEVIFRVCIVAYLLVSLIQNCDGVQFPGSQCFAVRIAEAVPIFFAGIQLENNYLKRMNFSFSFRRAELA
jgi:hypothetical protein